MNAHTSHVVVPSPRTVSTVHFTVTLLAMLAFPALPACVENGGAHSPDVKPFVTTEAPSPQHKLNVEFDGNVRLIGYDVATNKWSAGGAQTVTWYWQSEKKLESGWKLFTHVGTEKAPVLANVDNDSVVRAKYPPSEWQPGQYIRDVQTIKLPANFSAKKATVFVGIWKGKKRQTITAGPHDDANRARAFNIEVTASPAAGSRELPVLRSTRTAAAPVIDGKLDEPAWGATETSRLFVSTMTGDSAKPDTAVRSLWTDTHVYFAFTVDDDLLKSTFTNHDDHLWTQDCVEIMLDPDGDGLNYFEMQVSPRGTVFETRYDSRRMPRPFGHLDWDSQMQAKVVARGTVDDGDADNGYTVEIAVPWSAFNAGTPPATAPKVNDTWRANFYVMDTREEGQRTAGWSPLFIGDFHVPQRFGKLEFVTAEVDKALSTFTVKHLPSATPPNAKPKLTGHELAQENLKRKALDKPRAGEPVPTKANPNPR